MAEQEPTLGQLLEKLTPELQEHVVRQCDFTTLKRIRLAIKAPHYWSKLATSRLFRDLDLDEKACGLSCIRRVFEDLTEETLQCVRKVHMRYAACWEDDKAEARRQVNRYEIAMLRAMPNLRVINLAIGLNSEALELRIHPLLRVYLESIAKLAAGPELLLNVYYTSQLNGRSSNDHMRMLMQIQHLLQPLTVKKLELNTANLTQIATVQPVQKMRLQHAILGGDDDRWQACFGTKYAEFLQSWVVPDFLTALDITWRDTDTASVTGKALADVGAEVRVTESVNLECLSAVDFCQSRLRYLSLAGQYPAQVKASPMHLPALIRLSVKGAGMAHVFPRLRAPLLRELAWEGPAAELRLLEQTLRTPLALPSLEEVGVRTTCSIPSSASVPWTIDNTLSLASIGSRCATSAVEFRILGGCLGFYTGQGTEDQMHRTLFALSDHLRKISLFFMRPVNRIIFSPSRSLFCPAMEELELVFSEANVDAEQAYSLTTLTAFEQASTLLGSLHAPNLRHIAVSLHSPVSLVPTFLGELARRINDGDLPSLQAITGDACLDGTVSKWRSGIPKAIRHALKHACADAGIDCHIRWLQAAPEEAA